MTMGHDPAQSAVSHSTVAAPWMLSAVFSVVGMTARTTNGSSKSYNNSKDLSWVFACKLDYVAKHGRVSTLHD